ncbi:exopolygalacturonase [Rosa sericea]
MVSTLAIQCVCLVLLLVTINKVQAQSKVYNVLEHGAVADGKFDNSKVLSEVWNQSCHQNTGGGVILFPQGTFMVAPVVLQGHCKGPMELQVQGTLQAPVDVQSSVGVDHWISFRYVEHLVIHGGGLLDGQGASAWGKSKALPTTLRLDFVSHASIRQITFLNSKNTHIKIFTCSVVVISNINISAPGDSPNTDGIKISNSKYIQILDSVISVGDDCIACLPNSKNINITRVHCGPGHGFSIGSISRGTVTNLNIRNSSLVGTQNGVRIKTKAYSSQPGNVAYVTFEHIEMDNVGNPIIIDQNYCPDHGCSGKESSQVQIKNVKFNNIWGTSRTKTAVNFNCSQSKPCHEIELRDINLNYRDGGPANSSCSYVDGKAYGKQNPPSCL